MAKEKPNTSTLVTRTVKPKKTFGLTIRPALQLPLPHDDLIKPLDLIDLDQSKIKSLDQQDQLNDHSESLVSLNSPIDSQNNLDTLREIRPVQNLDQSKLDQSKNYTGLVSIPVQENLHQEIKAGYLKLPNEILDNVLPKLSPTEAVVFLRLYRLSVGFNTTTCTVGITSLLRACNISEQTCRTALRRLIDLKLVEQMAVFNNKDIKGTTYKILTVTEIRPVQNLDPSNASTSIKTRPNKIDDDPLKKQDHHQSEHEKVVMMIYQNITQNSWTKADISTYQKIKHIPVEVVETAIRLATQRATNRPNSLAYFIKEILSVASPKTNRSKQKKLMEKIVDRVRNSLVGSNYSISDFVFKVKELCLRKDIAFDNDLLDEILDRKN